TASTETNGEGLAEPEPTKTVGDGLVAPAVDAAPIGAPLPAVDDDRAEGRRSDASPLPQPASSTMQVETVEGRRAEPDTDAALTAASVDDRSQEAGPAWRETDRTPQADDAVMPHALAPHAAPTPDELAAARAIATRLAPLMSFDAGAESVGGV